MGDKTAPSAASMMGSVISQYHQGELTLKRHYKACFLIWG